MGKQMVYSHTSSILCCYCAREARYSSPRLHSQHSQSDRASAVLPESTTKPLRSKILPATVPAPFRLYNAVRNASSGRRVSAYMFWFWPQGRIDCTIEVIGNQIRQNVPPYFEADEV